MEKLEIRLFGSMKLMRGEAALTNFGSNKVRALLAYLVVESRRPHQRRKLGALLWPDIPETTALSNLRYALSNLRKAIGDRTAQPSYLVTTPQTIQFNRESNAQVDIALFEEACSHAHQNPLDFPSLLQAVDLYQGQFLEGFSIPDSIPFEEWIVLKRERFGRLAYRALHKLASYYEVIGDYDQAIAYAQRQIYFDPWREEVHRLIMRCLYFSGQRSAAIGQYEACCKSLESDLGIEPSPDTKALFEAIRANRLPAPLSPPAFFLRSPSLQPDRPVFVDQQEPLDRLHAALERVMDGHGELLLISGSAGQGKTALVREFIQQALELHPNLAAAWGNSQAYFGSGDPFLPFREILEMLTGQVEHRWEAGAISHDHARRLWHLTAPCAQAVVEQGPGLVGTFLSGRTLLHRVSYVLREETPWLSRLSNIVENKTEKQPMTRENLIQQYTRVLIEISHYARLLIFVDDLQWADQSSLDMFFYLARHLSPARVLLIGAFRPVEDPSCADGSSLILADMVNELQLQSGDILIDLDEQMDRNFIDAYLDKEPNQLGVDFREELFLYTHSHPLFTVEILHEMKRRGDLVINNAGEWEAAGSINWEHLPPRIEAAIKERLLHIPGELNDLLKTASVEGERFTAEVLADVQNIHEEEVLIRMREELGHQYRLVQADSSRRIDGNRLTRYRFRHILFQKYLYSQLDDLERAELHEKVGLALEQRYHQALEEIYLPLAIHFEVAGLTDRAIDYYDFAGRRAIEFSSYADAISHFEKALSLLEEKPPSMDRDKREFDLLLRISTPLMFVCGFASEEMRKINDRMAALLKRIPLNIEMFPIFHAIGAFYQMRGEYEKALNLLQEGELLARRSEEELLIRLANWGYGFNFLWLGKFEEALSHLEMMVNYYDPQVHGEFRKSYGIDAGVASRLWSSWTLWLLGFPEKALIRGQEAIDLGYFLDDPGNLTFALDIIGFLRLLIGETHRIDDLLESFGMLLEKSPMPLHSADFEFLKGFYDIQKGEYKNGINRMCQGIEEFKACGTISQLSMRLIILAEAYVEDSQWDQAAKTIREAEALIEDIDERFYKAEALRVKGKLYEKTGRMTDAETCYFEALQVAKGQKAKILELRAAMGLAGLLEKQSRIDDAYQTLVDVYNWFTEGFDTVDLLEAKTLLAELEQFRN